jgi:hypothetical protein
MKTRWLLLSALALLVAIPAAAKDSLGIFEDWGAFRDPAQARCYAISMAGTNRRAKDYEPFASVGTWSRRDPAIRNQIHIRLSKEISPSSTIRLAIGDKRFELTGGGGDAWAQNRQMDAAIVAAMRSAARMTISARSKGGTLFTDEYSLSGAATAMDAATVGCSRLR